MTGTEGNAKEEAHAFDGAVITGAVGKITTLTVLLISQAAVVPGGLLPHASE